ncbi:MAG: 30S ribosomal protein S8 [Pseudomonadota bacterium]
MSLQDPLADMFTRIRNGQLARKKTIEMPSSKQKLEVARVLKDEGYIVGYGVASESAVATLRIDLKYYEGKPVIEEITRVSRPGLRVYKKVDQLQRVKQGLGVLILSTNKGMMTDRAARKANVSGEIICRVS